MSLVDLAVRIDHLHRGARDLSGRGLNAVDAHLLASATRTPSTSLSTPDRRREAG